MASSASAQTSSAAGDTMDPEVVVTGLTVGSVYTLVAVGINVLYRPTNVFNFAQGELAMLGSMIGLALLDAGIGWWAAPIVVAMAVALVGVAEEQIAVAPVLRRDRSSITWLITTLGFSLVVSDLAGKVWESGPNRVPPPSILSVRGSDVAGVAVSPYQVALVAIAVLAVFAIERFYERTRTGLAILAVAEDREAAVLRGIDPRRLTRWSFAAGGAITGLAGLLAAPIMFASIELGARLLITGFMVAIVGGTGHNWGALVAGFAFGLVGESTAALVDPGMQEIVTFGALLLVLMVRPHGLFGRPSELRVV